MDRFTRVARKCSLLIVVGERSAYGGDNEARSFRDACISARQLEGNSSVASDHQPVSKPPEFDLQLLVVGGADHLLRLHPSTAKRWSVSQASVDSAITVSSNPSTSLVARLTPINQSIFFTVINCKLIQFISGTYLS